MHKVELQGEDFGNFNTRMPDMARNVTEELATRAGVWSTLKTVDHGRMMAEEEKIAVIAVVAVKKN